MRAVMEGNLSSASLYRLLPGRLDTVVISILFFVRGITIIVQSEEGGGLPWGYGCHGIAAVTMGQATGGAVCTLVGAAGCGKGCCVVALFVIVVIADCRCFRLAQHAACALRSLFCCSLINFCKRFDEKCLTLFFSPLIHCPLTL